MTYNNTCNLFDNLYYLANMAKTFTHKPNFSNTLFAFLALIIFWFISFISVINGQGSLAETVLSCPKALSNIPDVCFRFKCVHNITKGDCPRDTFYTEKVSLCGCCPGCIKYIGLPKPSPKEVQERCNAASSVKKWEPDCEGPYCPIKVTTCSPGLVCNENNGLCATPTATLDPCSQECNYKKTLHREGQYHWDPECNEDGSYAPKQCKGDAVSGICFCVDRCGQRIFGQQFRVDAKNQTCECSRRVSELQERGQIASLHCTSEGNFEPVQCDSDSGLCYCVEEKTGKMNGAVVPQNHWKTLQCLTPNVTNFMRDGHYLRKCESHHVANLKVIKEAGVHGAEISLQKLNCDYDGSYAPVQSAGSRRDCVYKNGTTIKDYFNSNSVQMDCNCARDQFLYQISGRPFSFVCELQIGNYPNMFDYGSYASCIDRDGIAYGDLAPSKYACCLDDTCSPNKKRDYCYDPTSNPNGYKSCCSWLYGGTCKGQSS